MDLTDWILEIVKKGFAYLNDVYSTCLGQGKTDIVP